MKKSLVFLSLLTVVSATLAVISFSFVDKHKDLINLQDLNQFNFPIESNNSSEEGSHMIPLEIQHEQVMNQSQVLEIKMIAGSLKMTSGGGNKLQVIIRTKKKESFRPTPDNFVKSSSGKVEIDLVTLSESNSSLWTLFGFAKSRNQISPDSQLEIVLPQKVESIEVRTVSADVSADSVDVNHGDFEVVSSDIVLSNIQSKALNLKSVSGSADLKKVKSPQIQIKTVSGNSAMESVNSEVIKVKTVGGDFKFKNLPTEKYRIDFQSVGGELKGNLPFQGNSARSIEVETVSGDAIFESL